MTRSWFSSKVEKRDSSIEGRGLCARADIAAGEAVAAKGGHVMTRAERDQRAETLGPAEIQIAEHLFLGPKTDAEREGSMLHLNHSCAPNLAIEGQIVFVALRDIEAGEELTFDYATGDDDDWTMACRCGSPDCRGIVTGRDWRKPELQRRYAGRFAAYLQRKIDGAAS
ncbi:SET domain-containing protein [Algihabitans albus]|uniref:SET domain-containing protein n=1 Tax=Algihabitans albus TaxID=2164067 RepID=UPI000E5CC704|nr:SET domain-containing protein-lysine N-methyltransferase [Algihabitans albus]